MSRMRPVKRGMGKWLLKLVFSGAVIFTFITVLYRIAFPLSVQYVRNDSFIHSANAGYSDVKELRLNVSEVLFPTKPLVMWSNDYHISPINDLKHLLKPLGVSFIDKSLSGHCHITNTCEGKNSLKVITRDNAMNLDPSLIPKFYEAYQNDVELQSVDAFVCFHPASMCELFMPFNKSLIVIASTRYELGRFGVDRWTRWNHNLQQIAKMPTNVVGGNNQYDVEYIKYFTGIQPQLLPSFCGYLSDKYTPSRPGFLLAPVHHTGFGTTFMSEYKRICENVNCSAKLIPLREKYSSYKYTDLTAHAGMVYIPYQVSVMSMFEQYRMNIPLFFPSLELLTTWQHTHMVMNERTWAGVHGGRPSKSSINAHESQANVPDPNNEQHKDAIRYWIKFADFYQMPHITYFDSVGDLVDKLDKLTLTDLKQISAKMMEYNAITLEELLLKWRTILTTIAKGSINAPH